MNDQTPHPFDADSAERIQAAHPGTVTTEQVQEALGRALTEIRRLVDAAAPAPCVMVHTPPFDFASCDTHDSTFPLGQTCRFEGRDPADVYFDEAHEQRRRAVVAELALERLQAAAAGGR